MNKIGIVIKGLIVAGAFIATGSVMAATSSGLGTTSTGTVDITVDVGDQISINGLIDMTGSYDPIAGDLNLSSPACVYKNGGSGNFGIVADNPLPAGPGSGAFTLGAGALTYTVQFTNGGSTQALPYNSSVSFTGASTTSLTCVGGAGQSTVDVTVPELGNLDSVAPGAYFGTLRLVVTPQ